jgi:hypothetical protein
MRYIGIIILLVLCLTLLLFTDCTRDTIAPEPANGNLANQEDIYQSSNNSQNSSTGSVEEPVIEDTEEPGTVYPQQWATGDGTVGNPWANDCIQKAYDFVPDGGTIFLKTGYYELSAVLGIYKQINIIGEGRNTTIIKTANERGFVVRHDNCTLKGFTIDGDSQTDGTRYISPIILSNCDYTVLEEIEVKNAGYYGIDIFQVNHSLFQNIYAHDNYRHGLHPGSNTTGRNKYNIYRDIYAWNNGNCGFNDRGNGNNPDEECFNIFDRLNCWDNGYVGIVVGSQKGGILSNSSASGNEKNGIWLYTVRDFNIHDCSTTLSGEEGIYIRYSNNLNFTNIIVKNNNVSDNNMSGIMVRDSNGIRFTSCQSYDDRVPPIQAYGIEIIGTVDCIEIINCILTPNKKSSILNDAGAVIIKAKAMLVSFYQF